MDKKHVVLIGAVALNGVYGQGRGVKGSIPWRSSVDMQFFRETTTPHTVVMGRGTYESIPPKFRPFKNRTNFVVTNDPRFRLSDEDIAKGVKIFNSISSAIDAAPTEKVFMIGAMDIWYNTARIADELLINRIGLNPPVDSDTVFFRDLLDPENYFDGFVQEGEPTILVENQGKPDAFFVQCYRYLLKAD